MKSSAANPIFIFASGQRCGSTLVQRFLCSHPSVLIWGEHDGVLLDFLANFDKIGSWEKEYRHQLDLFLTDGVNNFIANMNPRASFLRHAQIQLIRNLWELPALELGRPIWGFKEVRYDARLARLLRALYPGTRIIHLTRNILGCFISLLHWERFSGGWSRKDTVEFIRHWVTINQSFLESSDVDPSWVFSLTYEELIQAPYSVAEGLVEWIGFDFDDFDCDVFSHKIYTERYTGPDRRPRIGLEDLSEEDLAIITTDEIMRLSKAWGLDCSFAGAEYA